MRIGWEAWSIDVDSDWNVSDDPECITLEYAHTDDGAFQLSSFRKSSGDVSRADLLSFVESASADFGPSIAAAFGAFSGMAFAYREGDIEWRRWLLCNGSTLLLATFNGTESTVREQLPRVVDMLNTLRVEHVSA